MKLEGDDRRLLDASISMEEVRRAVWECESSKSPGPDGFNFNFIKRTWEIIKGDFFNCIKLFEATGSLSRDCSPSFIALVANVVTLSIYETFDRLV